MVVDEGIDPAAPSLKDRVIATYTITCKEEDAGAPLPGIDLPTDGGARTDGGVPSADAGAVHDPAALAAAKAEMIAALQTRDESCALAQGIAPKPATPVELDNLRRRWNATLKASRSFIKDFTQREQDQIKAALGAVGDYHGTATAGLIAADNPNVRLVLVERTLSDLQTVMAGLSCLPQAAIDQATQLMSDPDVEAAFVAQPLSTLDEAVGRLVADHGVQIVNESFGTVARRYVERLLWRRACYVDLRRYFEVMSELTRKREAAHSGPARLVVRAAGNESAQIDGPADSLHCYARSTPTMNVGSYDHSGEQTAFTNHGACVDVYAPGKYVLAPLPGGWLMPVSGTSFSAPLVIRMITQTFGQQAFSAAAIRDGVLATRDKNRRLPHALFPIGLVYDPLQERLEFALKTEDGDGQTQADQPLPRVDRRAVQQLLWPLRRSRR